MAGLLAAAVRGRLLLCETRRTDKYSVDGALTFTSGKRTVVKITTKGLAKVMHKDQGERLKDEPDQAASETPESFIPGFHAAGGGAGQRLAHLLEAEPAGKQQRLVEKSAVRPAAERRFVNRRKKKHHER